MFSSIKELKVIREHEFEKFIHSFEGKDDGYINLLVTNEYFTSNGIFYYVFRNDEKIGFIIVDNYNKIEHSAILYMYFLEEVSVELKSKLISVVESFLDNKEFKNLYIRVPEKNLLLKEAVSNLSYSPTGTYITNKIGGVFSSYTIYVKPLNVTNGENHTIKEFAQ